MELAALTFVSMCPWCYESFPCRHKCMLRMLDASKVVDGGSFLLVSPGAFVVERSLTHPDIVRDTEPSTPPADAPPTREQQPDEDEETPI